MYLLQDKTTPNLFAGSMGSHLVVYRHFEGAKVFKTLQEIADFRTEAAERFLEYRAACLSHFKGTAEEIKI